MSLFGEERFSEKHGFNLDVEPVIITRYSAPPELRKILIQIAQDCGISLHKLRQLICNMLDEPIDDNNWSDSYVKQELNYIMDNAEWYEVYDIIEGICAIEILDEFSQRMNKYFIKKGIGWKIVNRCLEIRSPEVQERVINNSLNILNKIDDKSTAYKELHYAIENLSKRPQPDITGAIQHAMSALECYCRSHVESKDTLGSLLKKNDILSPPLNVALQKLWAFASEQGRHLHEGKIPSFSEAQLTVGISACVITYLKSKDNYNFDSDEDIEEIV